MKTTIRNLKSMIQESLNDELEHYFSALETQQALELKNDYDGARTAAHRAAALFFVMSPENQTIASREARKRNLFR